MARNRFFLFSNRSVGDRRGQVAIFIALIFQILFLFFAMIVNVGLLVHHKINLQNSVDLAAYYGAMKQSEVMNAIGHVNYQIRQSFKLLTWRYRILGVAGVWETDNGKAVHPVQKSGRSPGNRGGSILGYDDEVLNGWDPSLNQYYEAPAFCLAFKPMKEVPIGENTCRAPVGQLIPKLVAPPIIAGFIGAATTAAQVTQISNWAQQGRCEFAGPYNYVALARFVVGFNMDQGERKLLIYKLANGLSQSTEDFLDIEGEKASEGIRKTLENNLSAANKASLGSSGLKIYNSLAHSACGETSDSSAARPPKWMSEVMIFPRSSYKMCHYSGSGSDFQPANIEEDPITLVGTGNIPPALTGPIQYLRDYVIPPASGSNSYLRPSLGVEKNPWCMAYVGVRAETEPEIPFSLGKIKLKAVAFAKPFGGKIGPWYGKVWPRSAEESQGNGSNSRIDPLTPSRCALGNYNNCTVQGQDSVTTVNYSRFPGDPIGLKSRRVQAQYGKSIYDMGEPSFEIWKDIERRTNDRGNEWDILAWDGSGGANTKMRQLEISAIVPDLFDLTYYSIDPDFYNNYYKDRIEKYLQKNPLSSGQGQYTVRMDLGSRSTGSNGGKPLAAFNIKDQMKVAGSIFNTTPDGFGIDFNMKLPYMLADRGSAGKDTFFGRLLTSWIPPRQIDTYDFKPEERFGQCLTPANDNSPTPGSCEKGGRTGYSVKIVSSDYLLDSHELGGVGGATDKIKNPPPPEFYR